MLKSTQSAPLMLGMVAAFTLMTGCANTRNLGTTAASFMKHAQGSDDPNIRHAAYAKLADPNCYDNQAQRSDAAAFLALRLDERVDPTVSRAVICRTLGELGCLEGRDALRRACDDPEAVIRAAACRALGKLREPEDAAILARIMAADFDADCRIAAIEGLGAMNINDERIRLTLIDGMENADPAVRLASYDAIRRVTGKDFGPDPRNWKSAYAAQAEQIAP